MTVKKTAIALPEELLAQVDRAAEERGQSRSRYITTVLRQAVKARRDVAITRRLNELFEDDRVRQDQLDGAQALDDLGTSWNESSW